MLLILLSACLLVVASLFFDRNGGCQVKIDVLIYFLSSAVITINLLAVVDYVALQKNLYKTCICSSYLRGVLLMAFIVVLIHSEIQSIALVFD